MCDGVLVAPAPVPEAVRSLIFDADLYELLTNMQNGIKTRVDKQQANVVLVRLDEARAALRAAGVKEGHRG